jgi:hypothetical protein
MSTAGPSEVLSPLEFKIRGLEQRSEELRATLQLVLNTLGLIVLRSVNNPSQMYIVSNRIEGGTGNDLAAVSTTKAP